MRVVALIPVLVIASLAGLFAETQTTDVPLPYELLEQAQQVAERARIQSQRAQQSIGHHMYAEAIELYSRFLAQYPAHEQAPFALDRMGTLYRHGVRRGASRNDSRSTLIQTLRKLTESGEGSDENEMAMNWIGQRTGARVEIWQRSIAGACDRGHGHHGYAGKLLTASQLPSNIPTVSHSA